MLRYDITAVILKQQLHYNDEPLQQDDQSLSASLRINSNYSAGTWPTLTTFSATNRDGAPARRGYFARSLAHRKRQRAR